MQDQFSYHEYVTDDSFQSSYSEYQKKYSQQIRESDKVLIRMIADVISEHYNTTSVSLLDIGCSTGNFLFHLKNTFQDILLTGGDAAVSVINKCKENPKLNGITFSVMDMLNLDTSQTFDIITANAVLYMFSDKEYEQAIQSASRCLSPGGYFIMFDFCHPYAQDIKVVETSKSHPKGLNLYFRPFKKVQDIFCRNSFDNIKYIPFSIPIDLARGNKYSDNSDGFEDLNSYTVKTEAGERLLFRGALYQPWCHLKAQKSF
jgi:ubiquinone/menaquinone biosynthesis C-methylase UbiE